MRPTAVLMISLLSACQPPSPSANDTDAPEPTDTDAVLDDSDLTAHTDTDAPSTDTGPLPTTPDAFADAVHSFTPGDFAGFGADALPDIVLGAPQGKGALSGSLHVLSLGQGGTIVLALTDLGLVDGPGTDLLVFENPFPGWRETGIVAVSDDAITWHSWPCASDDAPGGYPGCAGVQPVLSSPDNGIDPTDPAVAGGDAFDLASLSLPEGFVGRFVRITDSGANDLNGIGYAGTTGGFDLDAIAVVHGTPLDD